MLALFFEWYFLEVPAKIKKIWGNYLWFFGRYFALSDLGREFFLPWKGLVFKRAKRGFDLGDALFTAGSNLISRILGAFVRLFFVIIGLMTELFTLIAGFGVFAGWLALLPAIAYCFWKGLSLLL